jgi:hypothetical protein
VAGTAGGLWGLDKIVAHSSFPAERTYLIFWRVVEKSAIEPFMFPLGERQQEGEQDVSTPRMDSSGTSTPPI